MGILNNQNSQTPAQIAAARIIISIQNVYKQFANCSVQACNILWNTPNAAPADIATALGTSGTEIVQLAELAQTTLNSAATIDKITAPTLQITKTGYSITLNGNGSVTIAEVAK